MIKHVALGGTAMEVSELCLGSWMFGTESRATEAEIVDEAGALSILDAGWEGGVNYIDTANVYGSGRSEEYIGKWLAGKDRENFVIASKVFFALAGRQQVGLSRKIILAEIEGTLGRLGTDYLDIYYIHGWHEQSPIEETLVALNDLVRLGKVHYIGVSNFSAWQLALSQSICDSLGLAPISVIQPRYNAADNLPYTIDPYEMPLPGLFDACRYYNVAVCSFSPLAEGFLTGKYTRDEDGEVTQPEGSRGALSGNYGPFPDRWWRVLDAIEAVAAEIEATPAQVAIRWAMDVPDLTSIPIVGATSVSQLNETLAAADIALTREQYQLISTAGEYSDFNSHAYTYTE
jgi:aryl-alcohol dehydrogenase-like predicted oxidoreductase